MVLNGSVSFNEASGAEQLLLTLPINGQTKITSLFIDFAASTKQTTVILYSKIDGTNFREIMRYTGESVTETINLFGRGAVDLSRESEVVLICDGTGSTNKTIYYNLNYSTIDQGVQLSTDELVTPEIIGNVTFDSDTWWSHGGNGSISGGRGILGAPTEGVATSLIYKNSVVVVPGCLYRLVFDVIDAQVKVYMGGAFSYEIDHNTGLAQKIEFVAVSTELNLFFYRATNDAAKIDNVSLRLTRKNTKNETIANTIWGSLMSAITTEGSFGKKLADWTLGTDNKSLISTDVQDLSGTLDVNAKKLNGAIPNNLGGTAQTGDSFAIVNNGTYGNANLKTVVDAGFAAGAKEGGEKGTDAIKDALFVVDQTCNGLNMVLDSMSADVGGINDKTTEIKAKTDELTFTNEGKVDASIDAPTDAASQEYLETVKADTVLLKQKIGITT